ncbi:MAG: hypothetical protein NTU88_15950 [Armatimonadetes bacterium]|nr:hypothetical protein [Armatimonadota bacterium]
MPRHCFIEKYYGPQGGLITLDPDLATDEQLKLIYSNMCLTIRRSPHSAASEPCLVMWMLADLDIQPGQKVLEIGTGSGWNAGLLAFGVGAGNLVYSSDAQPDLVEQAGAHLRSAGIHGVNLRAGDAGYGWSEAAPFDRIMATVGCPDIPPAWHEQLAEGGALLVPLKTAGIGDPLILLRKRDGRMIGEFTRWSWFCTLQGDYWSDVEDILEEPFEPRLDALLVQEPKPILLSEPITFDSLFFARLKGLRFQGLRSKDHAALHGAYLHSESMSVFFPDKESPVLQVCGDSDLGTTVSGYHEEWIRLGRPRITDYRVELVDRDAICGDSRSWLDTRRHACLRFSLGQAG